MPLSPHVAGPPPLLGFVLRHLRARAAGGSRQQWETGYSLERRTVRVPNLIFVTRGRPVWVIDHREHPLKNGELLVVPPNVEHHAYCLTRRITLFSIHIDATLPGGGSVFDLVSLLRQQSVRRGSRLDCYLRQASDEYDRPSQDEAMTTMDAWAMLILRELLQVSAAAGRLTYRPIDPLVAGTLEELQRRVATPTTLADLARRSGYSPQHLNRVFGKVLGVTPLQHLTRLRMEQAATLLRESGWTVAAVAQAVGFEDPYYFSRVFRQHTGRSPARFRQEVCSDSPS